MSRHRMINIECPICKKEGAFQIWESINTTLDPEMKQAVLDKSAFLFKCPGCGNETYVDYGTLYHQMEDKIMIHYATTDENEQEILDMLKFDEDNKMNNLFKNMISNNYLIRIVRSQNALREKIQIFDAGLDDRIIEIAKIYIWIMYKDQNPNSKDVEIFFLKDNDENIFVILDDGRQVATAPITDEFYDSLFEKHNINPDDIRKNEYIIDFDWAWNAMGLGKTVES